MRNLVLALVASAAFALPAQATTVLSENFDNEAGGGATVTNYASFAQFDVASGSVDLLFDPNSFGLPCSSGSCVDLDGSTGAGGTLRTTDFLAFNAGDRVTLSFEVAGSQRGGSEDFEAGFEFAGATDLIFRSIGGAFGVAVFPGLPGVTGFAASSSAPSAQGYTTYSVGFRAADAGSAKALIGSLNSNDNVSVLLDNVLVDVTAVPEPATWAMMIGGFGLVGGAMRARRRGPATVTA